MGSEKQALQATLQSVQDQAAKAASEAARAAAQASQQRADAAKALSAANTELDNDRRQIDSLQVRPVVRSLRTLDAHHSPPAGLGMF